MGDISDIYKEVVEYYEDKYKKFGSTPQGVDWNGRESQYLRFEVLSTIIKKNNFQLADIGCGYAALYPYLSENFGSFQYLGCDISEKMVEAAKDSLKFAKNTEFIVSSQPDRIVDYVVASGIFNVKNDVADLLWKEYVLDTIDIMDRYSKGGFAFNCLTIYSDREKRRSHLYYADPCEIFDLCKQKYSKNVSLLHDYGLYEFTILVRK